MIVALLYCEKRERAHENPHCVENQGHVSDSHALRLKRFSSMSRQSVLSCRNDCSVTFIHNCCIEEFVSLFLSLISLNLPYSFLVYLVHLFKKSAKLTHFNSNV